MYDSSSTSIAIGLSHWPRLHVDAKRPGGRGASWGMGIVAVMMLMIGCRPANDAAPPPAPPLEMDPQPQLRQVIERYQSATHYHDRGRLLLTYDAEGQPVTEETKIDLDYAQPNQLRLSIERGINRFKLVSDGQQLWAAVVDPVTDDLRHQVVRRPIPRRPNVAEIYAATEMIDPANPNQMLSVLMGLPLNLHTSQLGLVLPDSAFLDLLSRSPDVQLLSREDLDGRSCERIEVTESIGRYVFWIDAATNHIRRIEYPTGELFQLLPTEQRPQNVRLVLDLQETSFERTAAVPFVFETDSAVQPVQYFVLPPRPLPTKQLGQEIPLLAFTDCNGQRETSQVGDGRIEVMIWFDRHAASQLNVQQVDQIYQQFAKRADEVRFQAICAEPLAKISSPDVTQLVAQWGISLPVTRDLDAAGRDALQITEAPTTIVLDAQRRLQMFEVGANPQLTQSVEIVLKRVLSGEDVSTDVLRNWQLMDQRFQQQLQLAAIPQGNHAPAAGAGLSSDGRI